MPKTWGYAPSFALSSLRSCAQALPLILLTQVQHISAWEISEYFTGTFVIFPSLFLSLFPMQKLIQLFRSQVWNRTLPQTYIHVFMFIHHFPVILKALVWHHLFPKHINPKNSHIQHKHLENMVQAAAKHVLIIYDFM